jgi:hypothetical protein
MTRRAILKDNEAMRRGNARKPRKLPDGEVAFRIPEEDWPVLMAVCPDLKHQDAATRLDAWKKFRHSPLAEKYLVVRTPAQVKRSNTRIIV